ncbi:SDR family oxidoreductase [Streptomyces sp. NBC_01476]|uniref:SDR family oxidoreductase n=1 Tax=Streptomyces sp. NBC_01476 TaxID=2903881 RepID=UPI002E373EA5|nr:SDR family oxidoreductase [Streptomyces sp. NBC_01476]
MTSSEQPAPATDRRVVIVTGGSRGIGRRIAERFAAAGHTVAIAYRSNTGTAEHLVEDIVSRGGDAIAVQTDVADADSVASLFRTTRQRLGQVDVVVHAAAVLATASVTELTVADMRAAVETNLLGTMFVGQQAARHLRDGGAIVNISSAITRNLPPQYAAYAASKAGVEAFTVVLARELGARGITVNAVAPGPTVTDMFEADLRRAPDPQAARAAIQALSPLDRVGVPDDIADVVLAVALDLRWIDGQIVHTSGGVV